MDHGGVALELIFGCNMLQDVVYRIYIYIIYYIYIIDNYYSMLSQASLVQQMRLSNVIYFAAEK